MSDDGEHDVRADGARDEVTPVPAHGADDQVAPGGGRPDGAGSAPGTGSRDGGVTSAVDARDGGAPDEIRDELPDDLDASGFVGAYLFPDNSRRRWPGAIYLVLAAACVLVRALFADAAIVNDGWLVGAALLAVAGVVSLTSGWRMHVDEKDALVKAQQAVGFPVGHASAQQVWRGLRSRPTWRVLCYSAEEPPSQRGLVLVDALDGRVLEHLVESDPDAERAV